MLLLDTTVSPSQSPKRSRRSTIDGRAAERAGARVPRKLGAADEAQLEGLGPERHMIAVSQLCPFDRIAVDEEGEGDADNQPLLPPLLYALLTNWIVDIRLSVFSTVPNLQHTNEFCIVERLIANHIAVLA